MEDRLQKLLSSHSDYLTLQAKRNKVVCSLNGHELPARFEAVNQFVRGQKYAKLKAAADSKVKLEKYDPFIVQSKNFGDKLYCALTCQLLGKSVSAVRQHMNGKKFQRAKENYQNDQLELMPEPILDSKSEQSMDASDSRSGGGEDDGIWVPEEFAEMEAEAAAEAQSGGAQPMQTDEAAAEAGDDGTEPSPAAKSPAAADSAPSSSSRKAPKKGKQGRLKRRRLSS